MEELVKEYKAKREITAAKNKQVIEWIDGLADDNAAAVPILKKALLANMALLNESMDLHVKTMEGIVNQS